MPHYHEEKHLTIVIPLNVIKMNGCVVEFVLAEENPFGLYHITTTKTLSPLLIWRLESPPFELGAKKRPVAHSSIGIKPLTNGGRADDDIENPRRETQ